MTVYAMRPPEQPYYRPGHHNRDWMTDAACRDSDPEMFFPQPQHDRDARNTTRYSTRAAQKICLDCPVIADCLTYALSTDARFGIWAGTTETDRARLTGRRKYG